jgi:1-deoxy-D-xylulose-5-phosphate synthase
MLPDRFIWHDSPYNQYESAELNARHIVAKALIALGRESEILKGISA